MASHVFSRCTKSMHCFPRQVTALHMRTFLNHHTRVYSNDRAPKPSVGENITSERLDELLAKPTWSIETLIPPKQPSPDTPKVSSQQLHHLLRLSALPSPKNLEEEGKMLDTLSAQLHFVSEIQRVNTSGIRPLRALRDETLAAQKEQTITLDTLQAALDKEKVVGKHYKRTQRDTTPVNAKDVEDWNVLGSTQRKAGKYFVVESERPQE